MKYIVTLSLFVLLARPVVAQNTIVDMDDMLYLVQGSSVMYYPVEGNTVSRFLASKVVFDKNGDTTITPGTWMYLHDSIMPAFTTYLSENGSALLFAPKSRLGYGIRRDAGSLHVVMAYGQLTTSVIDLPATPHGDERNVAYLVFDHPILYRDTMLMWKNVFGWFEDEKPIAQTAALIVEETKTGKKFSSTIVSCEIENVSELETGLPLRVEYASMMFLDENSEPILSKDTPHKSGHFKNKFNTSRTVELIQSIGGIDKPHVLQPIVSIAEQPTDVIAEQVIPVSVVEDKTVPNTDTPILSTAEVLSIQIAADAPKVLSISDGVQFVPDQSSTVISWVPVAGATIYRVRIVASDNSRDNTHLRTLPEMKFQLLRPGVSYEVSITPEDNNRHVVGPVYTVLFLMSEK